MDKSAGTVRRLVRLVKRGTVSVGLTPIHYAFLFTYVLGPGVTYDLRVFLLPYVAWIGRRYGWMGMALFVITTLPLGLFTYTSGPWKIGIGLSTYLGALIVGFLFAVHGDFRSRIKTVLARPLAWWSKWPYAILVLVGLTLTINFAGVGLEYDPLSLALLLAFLLGAWITAKHVPAEVVHIRHLLIFVLASFLFNAFIRPNVPFDFDHGNFERVVVD